MYIDILRRLRGAVERKRSENGEPMEFLLHDNSPALRSILVMDFLAKSSVITLEYPPPILS